MKTRFCPSPTGFMHLGNARTAIFNVLLALNQQGSFLVRIEDSDQARSEHSFTEALLRDLKWLHLHWQEGPEVEGAHGPYWQSQRQSIYDHYYKILEEKKLVYPCFCSDEQLMLNRKIQLSMGQPPRYPGTCRDLSAEEIERKLKEGLKPTLRFKIPKNQAIKFTDLVRGEQIFQSDDIGDFIIRRADGTAPFMFCNAIDDAVMKVTHALRGEDHLANTPRQILISNALGLTSPEYGHISLIIGSDGSKLSKRNGSRSVEALRTEGYLPLAVLNYLARLGHYDADPNWQTLPGLAKRFSVAALQKAPARFDMNQLNFWQKETIQRLSHDEFWQWVGTATQNRIPQNLQMEFLDLVRPNILFPIDVLAYAEKFFAPEMGYSEEALEALKPIDPKYFDTVLTFLDQHPFDYTLLLDYLKQHLSINGKALFQPLRLTLTGDLHGPELAKIFAMMGKEQVKLRFQSMKNNRA